MRGFLRETIVELVMSKAIWLYIGVTAIVCMIAIGTGQTGIQMEFNGQSQALGNVSVSVLSGFIGFLVFLMVAGSSGVFPRMLRKGTIDFYLARPLDRPTLLLTKFQSIYIVYATLLILCTTLVWLCLSFVWQSLDPRQLLLLVAHLYFLLLWMGVSILASLIGRSQGIAIMSVMVIWVFQSVIFEARTAFSNLLEDGSFPPAWLRMVVEVCYQILPKVNELVNGVQAALVGEGTIPIPALLTTTVFLVVVFALSIVIFRRNDY